MTPFLRTTLLLVLPLFGCSKPLDSRNEPLPRNAVPDVRVISRWPGEKQVGRRFALLVGVTKYDTLKVPALIGPANDVKLMGRTLQERFGFADRDIVILADCAGAAGRPTRANIQRHFERLAKEAQPGDQIVILLAGHGDQQPDQEPFDEPDGLDQIFLPCDAGKWQAGTKTVANALIDDEMDVWTQAITKRGAALWLIVDACHSGTMLRGGDEVARDLPEGTLVPIEALQEARKSAAGRKETTRGEAATPAVKPANPMPKLMALYACQRDQTEPELTAPPDGKVRQGLLTYTVCQVLCEAKTPLTYRELTQRIQAKYHSEWLRTSPVPLMEGLDQDIEVLGTKSWAGRSQLLFSKSEEGWKIRAGQLHGLTDGSILAVYPPAGQADAGKVVGHVRIRHCAPAECTVEPCVYGKLPAPQALSAGSRCELVYAEYGPMRLRVGIEGAGKDEGEGQRRARHILQEMAKAPDALIELTDTGRSADILVRVKGEKFYLLPAGVAQRVGEAPPGAVHFGPYDADNKAAMQEALTRIARARNLLKVVARGETNAAAELDVDMLKFKNGKDRQGVKLLPGPQGYVLQPGEWVGWRIKNSGRSRIPLDVTLLFMNSQYGVTPIFPKKGEGGSGINRFQPDGPSYLAGPFPVTAKTVGTEHMIVIAVKADGQPIDFTCLAQPTIERAREATRGQEGQALDTPLGRLLQGAMYGQAARDLGAPVEPEAQAFRLMSWSVPAQPAAKK